MLKIIKFEFLKVITSKLFRISTLLFIICSVGFSFYTLANSNKNDVSFNSYKSMDNVLVRMNKEEKKSFIYENYEKLYALNTILEIKILENSNDITIREYSKELKSENIDLYNKYINEFNKTTYKFTGDLNKEYLLFKKVKEECDYVSSYKSKIEEVISKAENLGSISIFKENLDTFSKKNIEKTANVYKSMLDTDIDYQIGKGIEEFTKNGVTDIIIILFCFIMAFILLIDEKENNLFLIIKSTKNGRFKTIFSKLITLFLFVLSFTSIIYILKFYFCGSTIGYGNLGASLQSLSSFIYSPLKISILEYCLLFIFTKMVIFTLIALFFFFLALINKNNISSLLCIVTLIVINIVFMNVNPNGVWNHLYHLNIFNILSVNNIYNTYTNLKLGNELIAVLKSCWILTTCFLILLTIASMILFIKKRELQTKPSRIMNKIREFGIKRKKIITKISSFELYKLLFTNKGIILILAFVLFMGVYLDYNKRNFSYNEGIYKNYMEILSGKLSKEKEDYIKGEKSKFDNAHQKLDEIEEQVKSGILLESEAKLLRISYEDTLTIEDAFNKVYDRYLYIKDYPSREFVYDTGYKALFRVNDTFYFVDISLVVTSIILFISFFAMEYQTGMIKILNTTVKGQRYSAKRKIGVSILVTLILLIISIFFEIKWTSESYRITNLFASIKSIPAIGITLDIPIICYLILMYILRLIMLIIIVGLILYISLKFKNYIAGIIISICIFIVPSVLALLGFTIFENISLYYFMNLANIQIQNCLGLLLYFAFSIIIYIGIYTKIVKEFK